MKKANKEQINIEINHTIIIRLEPSKKTLIFQSFVSDIAKIPVTYPPTPKKRHVQMKYILHNQEQNLNPFLQLIKLQFLCVNVLGMVHQKYNL